MTTKSQRFYRDYYGGKYSSSIHASRFQWVKDQFIGEVEGQNIVEIGGGDEGVISLLKRDNIVLQADVSKSAISKIAKIGIKGIIFDANVDALPYKIGTVDIVIALEVLEHLKSPQHLLEEISRVLKKDGFAVVSVPNAKKLRERHGFFYPALFEFKNFKEFLQVNGFEVINALPYGDYSFLSSIQGKHPFFFIKRVLFKLIRYLNRDYDFDIAHLFCFKVRVKNKVDLEKLIANKTKGAYI